MKKVLKAIANSGDEDEDEPNVKVVKVPSSCPAAKESSCSAKNDSAKEGAEEAGKKAGHEAKKAVEHAL